MTGDELQRIVVRLANMMPVRYWLHFNYPCQEPWLMALKDYECDTIDRRDRKRFHDEMIDYGALLDARNQVYIFTRTNEDGSPFTSEL